MKNRHSKSRGAIRAAVLGFVGLFFLSCNGSAESNAPKNFDNQGTKIFEAQLTTPQLNLQAESGGRTLANFYSLRQYPGSPPRIPHEVDLSFSGNETDCLSCHGKGGYSAQFGAYAPVTPHPENVLCYQCHATIESQLLFVETEWKSIAPPRLGLSFLSSSPPPVPHSLQMRENCIACHTGPGAVAEIRSTHAARGDCRQCHATIVQSAPLTEFERK
jgi:cytochrome c-type protein NapB